MTRRICDYFMWLMITLACCYGLKVLRYFLPGILTIVNVWLLARLCDDIHLSYQIDVFTIYFLVWQFSYPICQWCTHQLSWPGLIFHQGSMYLLPTIVAFILHNVMLHCPPSMQLALFWISAFNDV
jgi:hypothetical protein